ncbi:unnamed protein product [Larinioides sclopetarius]|uniref:MADF domain-containing protein n=1 Tax=Larinioides sclopetarius TaxID=280406 RepID=A0AAV1YXA5_9ARAC
MANYESNLINEIKRHPCLFIEDNAVFRDEDLKNKAWNEISRKLNLDVFFVQNEWQKLKECYQTILSSRSKSNNPNASQKPWKFEEQMKFMEYYLQPKKASHHTSDRTKQRKVVQTLEPELMEISSSASTSKTTEPERKTVSSNLPMIGNISSQGCTVKRNGMKRNDGNKAPFSSHRMKNTFRFYDARKYYDSARMENVRQERRAQLPDLIPKTSGTEDVPLPAIAPENIETEDTIVNESNFLNNRIPGRENVGSNGYLYSVCVLGNRIPMSLPLPRFASEAFKKSDDV